MGCGANPSVGYLDNWSADPGRVVPPKPDERLTYFGLLSRSLFWFTSASASSKNRCTCVTASEGGTTPRSAAWPPKASACLERSLSTCSWAVGVAASRPAAIDSYPAESAPRLSHIAAVSVRVPVSTPVILATDSLSRLAMYFATMKLIDQKKAILCVRRSVGEGLGPSGGSVGWSTVMPRRAPGAALSPARSNKIFPSS